MAKTEYMFVPGQIKWAKGLAEVDPEYHTYNALLLVTGEWRDKVQEAGCQMKFKKEDGGLYSFKIKKNDTRTIWDKDTKEKKEVAAGPPEVFLSTPDGKHVPVDPKTVGNGSEVLVKLEIYDTSKGGKGTRLVAVRVDNLIEYVPQAEPTVIGGGEMPF